MEHKIEINTEFIKLGQLLKMAGIADSGAMAKELIEQGYVKVNKEIENRRGRKIYVGDRVQVHLEEMEEIYVSKGIEIK